ncbi:MAG TPA: response regulator transcription factor [Drouetiella sp.]
MSKLLLIEDDQALAALVKSELVSAGWAVECAHNFGDGWQLLNNFQYDMVLLDWDLPGGTGLKLCREYRDSGGLTPIIFLTGKSDMDSKESGLDTGADDYVTKPFDIREILARIRSVQRRPRHVIQHDLSVNGAKLDVKLGNITYQSQTLRLSPTEISILEFFFRHPNQLFSGAQLFASVWSSDADAKEDTVRVHMHLLRKKLAAIGLKELIKTVRAAGYILETDASK